MSAVASHFAICHHLFIVNKKTIVLENVLDEAVKLIN